MFHGAVGGQNRVKVIQNKSLEPHHEIWDFTMKIFNFKWHRKETFEGGIPTLQTTPVLSGAQDGSALTESSEIPPPDQIDDAHGQNSSWAILEIKSALLEENIILAKKDAYKAARAANPGLAVYVHPEEWVPLQDLGGEALRLIHSLKLKTDGFVLGIDHPEVKALEAKRWFRAWERTPQVRPGYLEPFGESQTLRDSWAEQLRRERKSQR